MGIGMKSIILYRRRSVQSNINKNQIEPFSHNMMSGEPESFTSSYRTFRIIISTTDVNYNTYWTKNCICGLGDSLRVRACIEAYYSFIIICYNTIDLDISNLFNNPKHTGIIFFIKCLF